MFSLWRSTMTLWHRSTERVSAETERVSAETEREDSKSRRHAFLQKRFISTERGWFLQKEGWFWQKFWPKVFCRNQHLSAKIDFFLQNPAYFCTMSYTAETHLFAKRNQNGETFLLNFSLCYFQRHRNKTPFGWSLPCKINCGRHTPTCVTYLATTFFWECFFPLNMTG